MKRPDKEELPLPYAYIERLEKYIDFLESQKKESDKINCPNCGDNDMFSFKLTHFKCRGCGVKYTD